MHVSGRQVSCPQSTIKSLLFRCSLSSLSGMDRRPKKLKSAVQRGSTHTQTSPLAGPAPISSLTQESLIFHSLSTSLWPQRRLPINVLTDNCTCSPSYTILCVFKQREIRYNGTLHKTRRFLYGKALWVKSSPQSLENRLRPRCPQKMLLKHRK